MKKRSLIALLVLVVMLMTVPTAAFAAKDEAPYRIGVVSKVSNPYMDILHAGLEKKAEELGIEMLLVYCEGGQNMDEQIALMANMIQKQVDAIVIMPCGSSELAPITAEAIKAGIPVVNGDNIIDREILKAAGVADEDIPPYIGVDNFYSGNILGKAVFEELGGKGKIAFLEGFPGVSNTDLRRDGVLAAAEEYPGIEVVAVQSGELDPEKSMNVMANILTANPDLAAVLCVNDPTGYGAVQAIDQAGLTGKVIVAGIDAEEQMLRYILEDKAFATIYQNQDAQGEMMLQVAYDILEGKGDQYSPDEHIIVDTLLVTKENAETYMP